MKLGMILFVCAIAMGCGYGSSYQAMMGGASVPAISQLSPSQVPPRQSSNST